MHVVQILLPLTDNEGKPHPREIFDNIKRDLTTRFKGLTAYSRAPAEGLWKPRKGTKRDDIIVYEVMVPSFRLAWWKNYRMYLEKLLRQESIVIRAQKSIAV
jgi:hypothetical protein